MEEHVVEEKIMEDVVVVCLARQVLARVPLRAIKWNGVKLDDKSQQELIAKVFKSKLVLQYPPPPTYLLTFIKALMKQIENQNYEVIEELYEVLGPLVSSSTPQPSEYFYTSYYLGTELTGYITLKESGNLVSSGTTGLHTWQASFCLAEWAMENQSIFRKKRVVEIGSGCGFLGLAVCKVTRPCSYTFTDCHHDVLQLLQENIDINNKCNRSKDDCFCDLKVVELDLYNPHYFINDTKFDVLIGSDIVFDTDLSVALVAVLKNLLENNPHCSVFIASTIRNEDTYRHFTDLLGN